MRIIIDTQLATEEEVTELIEYLKKESWDFHKEGNEVIRNALRRRRQYGKQY